MRDGEYRYTNGFSIVALVALTLAVLPNLPGFLVTVKLLERRGGAAVSRRALQLRVVCRFRHRVHPLYRVCAG